MQQPRGVPGLGPLPANHLPLCSHPSLPSGLWAGTQVTVLGQRALWDCWRTTLGAVSVPSPPPTTILSSPRIQGAALHHRACLLAQLRVRWSSFCERCLGVPVSEGTTGHPFRCPPGLPALRLSLPILGKLDQNCVLLPCQPRPKNVPAPKMPPSRSHFLRQGSGRGGPALHTEPWLLT